MSALDAIQATVLITKHLDRVLPWLVALSRVPASTPQRVFVLKEIATEIANHFDVASDFYRALELLTGEDLSTRSVADLLIAGHAALTEGRMADLWSTAYKLGVIEEDAVQRWLLFEGLANDNGTDALAGQ